MLPTVPELLLGDRREAMSELVSTVPETEFLPQSLLFGT
jgi:hypothetical protein